MYTERSITHNITSGRRRTNHRELPHEKGHLLLFKPHEAEFGRRTTPPELEEPPSHKLSMSLHNQTRLDDQLHVFDLQLLTAHQFVLSHELPTATKQSGAAVTAVRVQRYSGQHTAGAKLRSSETLGSGPRRAQPEPCPGSQARPPQLRALEALIHEGLLSLEWLKKKPRPKGMELNRVSDKTFLIRNRASASRYLQHPSCTDACFSFLHISISPAVTLSPSTLAVKCSLRALSGCGRCCQRRGPKATT